MLCIIRYRSLAYNLMSLYLFLLSFVFFGGGEGGGSVAKPMGGVLFGNHNKICPGYSISLMFADLHTHVYKMVPAHVGVTRADLGQLLKTLGRKSDHAAVSGATRGFPGRPGAT